MADSECKGMTGAVIFLAIYSFVLTVYAIATIFVYHKKNKQQKKSNGSKSKEANSGAPKPAKAGQDNMGFQRTLEMDRLHKDLESQLQYRQQTTSIPKEGQQDNMRTVEEDPVKQTSAVPVSSPPDSGPWRKPGIEKALELETDSELNRHSYIELQRENSIQMEFMSVISDTSSMDTVYKDAIDGTPKLSRGPFITTEALVNNQAETWTVASIDYFGPKDLQGSSSDEQDRKERPPGPSTAPKEDASLDHGPKDHHQTTSTDQRTAEAGTVRKAPSTSSSSSSSSTSTGSQTLRTNLKDGHLNEMPPAKILTAENRKRRAPPPPPPRLVSPVHPKTEEALGLVHQAQVVQEVVPSEEQHRYEAMAAPPDLPDLRQPCWTTAEEPDLVVAAFKKTSLSSSSSSSSTSSSSTSSSSKQSVMVIRTAAASSDPVPAGHHHQGAPEREPEAPRESEAQNRPSPMHGHNHQEVTNMCSSSSSSSSSSSEAGNVDSFAHGPAEVIGHRPLLPDQGHVAGDRKNRVRFGPKGDGALVRASDASSSLSSSLSDDDEDTKDAKDKVTTTPNVPGQMTSPPLRQRVVSFSACTPVTIPEAYEGDQDSSSSSSSSPKASPRPHKPILMSKVHDVAGIEEDRASIGSSCSSSSSSSSSRSGSCSSSSGVSGPPRMESTPVTAAETGLPIPIGIPPSVSLPTSMNPAPPLRWPSSSSGATSPPVKVDANFMRRLNFHYEPVYTMLKKDSMTQTDVKKGHDDVVHPLVNGNQRPAAISRRSSTSSSSSSS